MRLEAAAPRSHACRKAISNPRIPQRARRRGGAKPDATLPSLDPWSDSHGFKMIYPLALWQINIDPGRKRGWKTSFH